MTFDWKRDWAAWLVVVALAGVLGTGAIKTVAAWTRGETVRGSAPSGVAVAAPPAGRSLSKPDHSVALPAQLAEISGLSTTNDPKALWAVHDERGSVFKVSVADGKLVDDIAFSQPADYEGVEEIDGQLFVARSDGVVFEVDPESKQATELSAAGSLGNKCDLEGMGHQPEKKRLLLACKGAVGGKKAEVRAFQIHAMDLATRKVDPAPAYVVTSEQIDAYLNAHADEKDLQGLEGKSFGPSGLSVHPQTGEVHVLSSTGQMLVVLNREGAIVRIHPLIREVHSQPEGITFAKDGTLFISNEARGKTATLHTFKGM